ncbi:MAG: gamma carbonic anhydrase family protein [Leptospiraceae bacterium]|nr:gamma carbonic anhydrase family protein [Leptospiraceae bacterium]MDW7975655.1 gamma carbonic anhydrase family protein [Leptospiraceae bacterium]
MIYPYREHYPEIGEGVFIAPSADVIGQVKIGKHSSIWFGSLVRGDVDKIEIGDFTNIQDQCVVHVTGGKFPTYIGNHCTLGHRVVVHGAVLKDYAFIGIGAIVMDGCEVGEFAILAAGSLLPPGKKIPDGMLAMGVPAKVVRAITDEEREMIIKTQEKYAQLAKEYLERLGRPTHSNNL